MRDETQREEAQMQAAGLIELGAATERTLGPWDPELKENYVIPEAFPV